MSKQLLAKGMGASPGTATGAIVFRSEDAVELASQGKAVILVRIETTPEDVPGMKIAAGIVTTRGGITGDAAIVARSLGKPCIASCAPLHVDYTANSLTVWGDSSEDGNDIVLKKGDLVTIDGSKGEIWVG
jgi:pyruvate,orthophosphate dikinase